MKRKKNEEIKGRISSSSLILVYMIHLPTVHVCTRFQSSRPQFPRKVLPKISMLKIGEKEKWRNKGTNKQQLDSVYMIHLPTVDVCTNFQSSRPHSSWEKCDKKFQCWKLERKENEEIKGQISSSSLIPVYMIHLPTVHVCTKFQSSRPHSSWGKCDQKFQCWKLERKKNEEIMRWIRSSSLIPVYMIHLPTVYVCTKFQSSRPHSSWEKSGEKFQCWKLERKKNEEIKGWISSSTWYICPLSTRVLIFNLLGLIVPEESVTKNFHVENWREKKWRNKGTNKQQQPASCIHDTPAHCLRVYNFSIF